MIKLYSKATEGVGGMEKRSNSSTLGLYFDNTIDFHPDTFDRSYIKSLDKKRGIYFIFDEDDTLLYIGKSHNLGSRFALHLCNSSQFESAKYLFDKVSFMYLNSPKKLLSLEEYFILKYEPPLNSQYLGKPETHELEYEINNLNRVIKNQECELDKLKTRLNRFENLTVSLLDKDELKALNIDADYESMNLYFNTDQHHDDFFEALIKLMKTKNKYKHAFNSLQDRVNLIFDEVKNSDDLSN